MHGWWNKVEKEKNFTLFWKTVLSLGTYVIQPERKFHLNKDPTCEAVASLGETVIHSLLESYVSCGLKWLTQCVNHCRRLKLRTTMQTEQFQRTFVISNIDFVVSFSAIITSLTLCSFWLLKEIVVMNTFGTGDSKISTLSLCHLKFRWNCLLL